MDQLSRVVDTLRASPLLEVVIGLGVIAGGVLLFRKPKIQRDADERLSALRRDKPDQYGKLRRPP
jgi:hypothetical protein